MVLDCNSGASGSVCSAAGNASNPTMRVGATRIGLPYPKNPSPKNAAGAARTSAPALDPCRNVAKHARHLTLQQETTRPATRFELEVEVDAADGTVLDVETAEDFAQEFEDDGTEEDGDAA
jgi:hypothetical protein